MDAGALEYALFSGSRTFPRGGWADHQRTGSLEGCKAYDLGDDEWAHIVHLPTGKIVLRKKNSSTGMPLNELPWLEPTP